MYTFYTYVYMTFIIMREIDRNKEHKETTLYYTLRKDERLKWKLLFFSSRGEKLRLEIKVNTSALHIPGRVSVLTVLVLCKTTFCVVIINSLPFFNVKSPVGSHIK